MALDGFWEARLFNTWNEDTNPLKRGRKSQNPGKDLQVREMGRRLARVGERGDKREETTNIPGSFVPESIVAERCETPRRTLNRPSTG